MLKKIIHKFYTLIKGESSFTRDILKERQFKIGEFTYGHPIILEFGNDGKLVIGKFCSIAAGVKIFLGGNHRIDWISTYPFSAWKNQFPGAVNIEGHPATRGNVVIGNDVWLGHSSTIMSGVSIADGAVVGANAVITKDIGPYEIWAGNPARLIRKRFSDLHINMLLETKWWELEKFKIDFLVQNLMSENIEDFIEKVNEIRKKS